MKRSWLNSVFFKFLLLLCLALPGTAAAAEDLLPDPGKPLTLEQVKKIALKFHPALRASQEAVLAAKARIEQSLAAYYPQATFNASYNGNTTNFVAVQTTANVRQPTYLWTFLDIFSMGPTFTQTLYDFGRTANTVQASRENAKATEQDVATTQLTVLLNVKQAYFQLLQTQRLVDVAKDVVNQTKQHLEQAQGFFQAGTRPKIDVTKAEVDMANAELALIQSGNNLQVAQANLNSAMGLQQSISFPIEDNLTFAPPEYKLEEIFDSALSKRPEILQLKAKQRAQESTIKLAQSGYYPIFSANLQNLWRSPGINFQNLNWDIFTGVNMTVPFFSGFLTPNQVAEGRATLRNLQAQEENTKLGIRLEAEQAFLGLKLAGEQIRVTEKIVSQAKENWELAAGRYQVGVGSPLEVTDAEVSLANARVNNITALANYKIAEAKIDKAMGLDR